MRRPALCLIDMHKGCVLMLFVMLFTAALPIAGAETPAMQAKGYTTISAEQAKELMDTEMDYILLDVRTQQEFDEGHLPGAVLLPNEDIVNASPELLPDKEQLILIYCRSGNRSKQASEKLAALGYLNLFEIGGILDWPYEIVK